MVVDLFSLGPTRHCSRTGPKVRTRDGLRPSLVVTFKRIYFLPRQAKQPISIPSRSWFRSHKKSFLVGHIVRREIEKNTPKDMTVIFMLN